MWDIVTMVPGDEPLHSLAAVMLPLVEPELSGYDLVRQRNVVANDLKESKTPLWDLVAEALRQQQGTDRLLLVVDQWEELYTQCRDADARRRFIDELLDATAQKQSRQKSPKTPNCCICHSMSMSWTRLFYPHRNTRNRRV